MFVPCAAATSTVLTRRFKQKGTDVVTHVIKVIFLLLQTLCFRRNLIIKIEGLDRLVTLQELDLYDNQIEKIENLEKLMNLKYRTLNYFVRHAVNMYFYIVSALSNHPLLYFRTLDLSFNTVKVMENLTALVELEELYLIQNNISKIEGLTMLSSLTSLELGANKIRVCFIRKFELTAYIYGTIQCC